MEDKTPKITTISPSKLNQLDYRFRHLAPLSTIDKEELIENLEKGKLKPKKKDYRSIIKDQQMKEISKQSKQSKR